MALAPVASADSVTWTLNNFVLDDGATASGSFVYDASTNSFSSIDIVTTGAGSFTGATYTALDPGFGPFPFNIAFVTAPLLPDYLGTPVIELGLVTNLSASGGTISADLNEFICTNSNCSTASDFRGSLDGSTLTGVVSTPEPSSLITLAGGLFALFASRRRSTGLRSLLTRKMTE